MISVNFNRVFVETNIALGNHMFQYCVCRLSAEKNGYNFYIPYGQYLTKCFPNIDLGMPDGQILHTYVDDNSTQRYNPSVFHVQNFTNLHGFDQTDKYFIGDEEKIKSWFKVDIDDNTKKIVDKYPVDNFCYIHIRGGDYKASDWLLPKEYYESGIKEIRKFKSDISFVIITDDVELSKSLFPDIDVISLDVVSDFKSLYYSRYSIISNSSFSWWASWLSNKEIVIAPNNWLNYNNPQKGFYPVDIKTDKFIYI